MALTREQKSWIRAFGANVRRERANKGLTQEKLAELANLNPRTIQKIEAGDINILLTTIVRVKRALGCSFDRLIGDD